MTELNQNTMSWGKYFTFRLAHIMKNYKTELNNLSEEIKDFSEAEEELLNEDIAQLRHSIERLSLEERRIHDIYLEVAAIFSTYEMFANSKDKDQ